MTVNKMKISEFSEVTGISRRNLLYYDQVGLLKPFERSEDNQYRYYSTPQIAIANVIIVLKESGMSLKAIKEYLNHRSPEELLSIIQEQRLIIQEKIDYYFQIENMLAARENLVSEGLKYSKEEPVIEIVDYPTTPLFVGPPLSIGDEENIEWYDLYQFYEFCEKNKVARGLPVGTIFSRDDLLEEKISQPANYYYRPHSDTPFKNNDVIPAGRFIEYRGYVSNYDVELAFQQLFHYIKENGLNITGNAYMEFLLDETSLYDVDYYLAVISIQIEESD